MSPYQDESSTFKPVVEWCELVEAALFLHPELDCMVVHHETKAPVTGHVWVALSHDDLLCVVSLVTKPKTNT